MKKYAEYIRLYNKEDGNMCEILRKLKGKTATDLLEEYNISQVPPINISLLLRRIGILEIPFDFSQIEDLMGVDHGDVLGAIFAKGDSLGVFYKSSDSLNRKRFTLAHEIAHCCIHTDSLKQRHLELRNSHNPNDPKEVNANIFAGELLIPETSLHIVYDKFLGTPSLFDLAKIFNVSINVMKARLDYLDLPYKADEISGESNERNTKTHCCAS